MTSDECTSDFLELANGSMLHFNYELILLYKLRMLLQVWLLLVHILWLNKFKKDQCGNIRIGSEKLVKPGPHQPDSLEIHVHI